MATQTSQQPGTLDPSTNLASEGIHQNTAVSSGNNDGTSASVPAVVAQDKSTPAKDEAPKKPVYGRGATEIILRCPSSGKAMKSKVSAMKPESTWAAPTLDFLERRWTVTHSTLSMWKAKKNVAITYAKLGEKQGKYILDDTVESEPKGKKAGWLTISTIKGIDTPDPDVEASWNWRGKGLLKITSSHWEILGWGERDVLVDGEGSVMRDESGNVVKEKWVVTWFAPSMFTAAGLDVYCDRKEGISEGLYEDIREKLLALEVEEWAQLTRHSMIPVAIEC